ncbi:MAG: NAD(+)/NADH kinase [Candidatus Ratteibacteria bacterium]|nr:NAD(+)/NADH kinase [Candidatus Ratteibacteria bacterium]
MKKIGIVTNFNKKNAARKLEELLKWLAKKGKTVVLDKESAGFVRGKFSSSSLDEIASRVDLLISLGGDGTLLRAARIKNIDKIPVLGVNLGGLGFITEIPFSEIHKVLQKVFAGKFKLEERMRFQIEIFKKGKEKSKFTALNELVLAKITIARLLQLEIFINKDYVTTYQCDGLIVSTPTGSTGHSLSAGGAIMEPTVEGVIICPICPHTLTNRPLIIPSDKEIRIKTKPATRTRDICATIDGQVAIKLLFDDTIVIKKSPHKLKLVVSPERSYYQVLREKLSWGSRGDSSNA